MIELAETKQQCPYCGENIELLIDRSIDHQSYIEDCQVCCQPITIDVSVSDEGEVCIFLLAENE